MCMFHGVISLIITMLGFLVLRTVPISTRKEKEEKIGTKKIVRSNGAVEKEREDPYLLPV